MMDEATAALIVEAVETDFGSLGFSNKEGALSLSRDLEEAIARGVSDDLLRHARRRLDTICGG